MERMINTYSLEEMQSHYKSASAGIHAKSEDTISKDFDTMIRMMTRRAKNGKQSQDAYE